MRRLFLAAALLLAVVAAGCSRDPKVLSAKYIETGNKYFNRREYREASIMYRRALQKDLKSPDAYYRLGLTDLELHNWSDAARSLQRAAQLDPSNADAASKLADLYFANYLSNQKANAADLNEV
ncbi:MAG: tetratricopeptide repeat protein, partial [Bryobacteraceae bacterium]